MKYGVFIFPTEYTIGPAELAQAVEARGFESLTFPEHTHIPTSRRTPSPGGGELGREYPSCLEPFVSLAAAATVTKRIKLITGICLIIERDPILTAKTIATLDVLSGGRVVLGVGAGWNLEEMENHGTDPKTRRGLLRERIEAMKAIWTQDEAQYHGRFVNFDPIWSWPKPVQKPHPPILMGGTGSHALKGAAEFCDGWMPPPRLADLPGKVAELRSLAQRAGRDPEALSISVFWATPTREAVEKYAAAGAERVIFGLPAAARDVVLPKLDELARLIEA